MPSCQTSFFLMPASPPGHSPSRGIQKHGILSPKACSDRNTTHSGRKRPNCSAPYLSVPELNSKGKGGLLPTCAVSMLGFWQHRRAHSSSSPELMGPWGCLSKGNAENQTSQVCRSLQWTDPYGERGHSWELQRRKQRALGQVTPQDLGERGKERLHCRLYKTLYKISGFSQIFQYFNNSKCHWSSSDWIKISEILGDLTPILVYNKEKTNLELKQLQPDWFDPSCTCFYFKM